MQIYDPSSLRWQVKRKKNQKTQNLNSIEKKENAYDSLVRFNQTVAAARDSFEGVNNGKKNVLQEIEYTRTNCETSRKYIDGMEGMTNGLGKKTVSGAYSNLLSRSKSKLSKYLTEIANLEKENNRLDREIRELERQIREIEEQLAQDGVIGG